MPVTLAEYPLELLGTQSFEAEQEFLLSDVFKS